VYFVRIWVFMDRHTVTREQVTSFSCAFATVFYSGTEVFEVTKRDYLHWFWLPEFGNEQGWSIAKCHKLASCL